jgi:exodeoxyribonuclease VII large subunit
MSQISFAWDRNVRTVTQLTAEIRGQLSTAFDDVWVSGEISGVKPASSGHIYFTLKDAGAQIRCACFKSSLRFLRFKPQEGIQVIARGRVDVYEPRGEYQLLVEALQPKGFGELQLAFEQLKRKLEGEGLFDPARKRELPKYPRRIGIVTSPSGAVIQDMIRILDRRFPGLHIRLYPALVQGQGSIEAILEGIEYFSESGWADVLIVGRGGGSLEDLWTFNEEAVARAIAGCRVPVISAVGHETDFTIADFAADLRAPTPSAAAELAVTNRVDLIERIGIAEQRAERAIGFLLARLNARVRVAGTEREAALLHRRLGRASQRIDEMDYSARHSIRDRIAGLRVRADGLEQRLRALDPRVRLAELGKRLGAAGHGLTRAIESRLARERRRLDPLAASLAALSPLNVLDRGYAIVQDEAGHVLSDSAAAAAGTGIRVRLRKGRLVATISAVEGS